MDRPRTKSELLYCMDFIMHHLNDEEAIEPWLTFGVEDGLYGARPPAEGYEQYDGISDKEFDGYVALFTRILAREVIPDLPDMSDYKTRRRVLC